jgi:hypothetical protein
MVTDRPFYTEEDKRWDLVLQEMEVKRYFPEASVNRKKGILLIKMPFKNPGCHQIYHIGAFYRPNVHPLVFILEPYIKPFADIHMYAEGHLCLYDPADIGYRKRFSMAKEILPWTFKWILYYEAWLTNGHYWMGSETAHGIRMTEEELELWYRRA